MAFNMLIQCLPSALTEKVYFYVYFIFNLFVLDLFFLKLTIIDVKFYY